jgi:hypothetical protein
VWGGSSSGKDSFGPSRPHAKYGGFVSWMDTDREASSERSSAKEYIVACDNSRLQIPAHRDTSLQVKSTCMCLTESTCSFCLAEPGLRISTNLEMVQPPKRPSARGSPIIKHFAGNRTYYSVQHRTRTHKRNRTRRRYMYIRDTLPADNSATGPASSIFQRHIRPKTKPAATAPRSIFPN